MTTGEQSLGELYLEALELCADRPELLRPLLDALAEASRPDDGWPLRLPRGATPRS